MDDQDRLTKTFLDLLRINSPSKNERGVADYVKPRLVALGFEVEEDDTGKHIGGSAGNVIAFKRGNAPGARSIFLCCHMDTVEPTSDLEPVVSDGIVRSRGNTILGADNKAGIAAVLEGVEQFLACSSSHPDIQILFDVSEEIGLLGAKNLDKSKIRARLGYVLDTGAPVAGVVVSAPSHESIKVEIQGRAAHAGVEPEKGVSAIVAAANAIAKMKLGRIDFETTANIGVIEGGKARNIVPDKCIVRGEARSRNEDKLAEQVRHMTDLFAAEAAKIGAAAQVQVTREYSGFRFTKDDEVVRLAVEAARGIGIEPELQDGGGGSDANVFNEAGIPSVVLGVGYHNPHTPDEYISLQDLRKAAQLVASLLNSACKCASHDQHV
ncbi:MAG: M20/M25/M40 family metallo-hydrolase [Armatimonadota bacterium]|nr:M20/M25/M40 family metallo-hydrolase [Armatimonadota bacterium]